MKKFVSILAVLVLCTAALVVAASAATVDEGTCGAYGDNLTWTLDDSGTLTVSGTGEMKSFEEFSDAPWYSDRSSVTAVVVEDGVTSIGDCAFYNCTALSNVTIPVGVETIGAYAFFNCDGLRSVTVPASVTDIEQGAFESCDMLETAALGGGVRSLGMEAFYNCAKLSTVTGEGALTSMGEGAFARCLELKHFVIPNGVTVVAGSMFVNSGLTEIEIHDGVRSIRLYALSGCSTLTDIYYGGSKAEWAALMENSTDSLPGEITVHYGRVVPDTPTTSLSIKASNGKPRLTWKAVEGATKYEIWRAVGKNSGYTKVHTMTGTTYVNTAAKAGTTYYYKVRAVGPDGKSGFSAAKYITCDCAQPVVTATLNANDKPKLTWEKVTGAVKYEIWRAVGQNSGYKKIHTMTGNVFVNSSVAEGVTYYYKVRAICGTSSYGNSAFSTARSVATPAG